MVKVIDRDLGYTVAVKYLEAFAGKSVEAGVFANAGMNGKTSLADIAVWNEYGVTIAVTPKMRAYFHSQDIHLKKSTTSIRIPARPFMRQAADKNATKWAMMPNGWQLWPYMACQQNKPLKYWAWKSKATYRTFSRQAVLRQTQN